MRNMRDIYRRMARGAWRVWIVLVLACAVSPVAAFARDQTALSLELWREGRIEEALNAMKAVLYAQPDDPEAWNDFGMMNLAMGNVDEAEKAFARTLSLEPGHAGACLNMGNLLRHQRKPKRALEWFNTGLAWHSKDVRLLLGRAQARGEFHDYLGALKDFRAAFALASQNTHVLNEYAWFLATCPDDGVRDGKRALELARKAVVEAPGPEAGLYDTLAAALAECGRFDEAADIQKKALALAENNGYPKDLLEAWRERYGMYKLNMPYRQHADNAH